MCLVKNQELPYILYHRFSEVWWFIPFLVFALLLFIHDVLATDERS